MDNLIGFALDKAARLQCGEGDRSIVEKRGDFLDDANGVIVASWLKHDGVWWDEIAPERLAIFMAAANRACA